MHISGLLPQLASLLAVSTIVVDFDLSPASSLIGGNQKLANENAEL